MVLQGDGQYPIHFAARGGHDGAIKILLSHGANVREVSEVRQLGVPPHVCLFLTLFMWLQYAM